MYRGVLSTVRCADVEGCSVEWSWPRVAFGRWMWPVSVWRGWRKFFQSVDLFARCVMQGFVRGRDSCVAGSRGLLSYNVDSSPDARMNQRGRQHLQ